MINPEVGLTGLEYRFGNKKVFNKFVGTFQFPINYIRDSYHRSSYVASALYDHIFSADEYKKYDLVDPNKTYLEGRS
jgi:hypothetical protein